MSEQIELAPSIKEIFAALLDGDLDPEEAEALVQDHIEAERISLRDEFAARAPAPPEWWMTRFTKQTNDSYTYAAVITKWNYVYADSMLEARKK